LFPFVLLALCIMGIMAGAMWFAKKRPLVDTAKLPEGYVSDSAALKTEFDFYYGPRDEYAGVSSRFRSAADLAAKRNLPAVASVLESISKNGNLPVVFHNLGIVYTALGDHTRAADSFREALAHDAEYAPTRKFLRDAKGIPGGSAEPYTREKEPNNDNLTANLIALRAPVGGEIVGGSDSADYYRFSAPPAPRDLVAVEVANHSGTFAPRLHVYDDKFRSQDWGDKSERAGGSLKVLGGPAPNASLRLSITSEDGKGGLYLLTVTPLKAFDRYEPNDEIMGARSISIGEEISANVMDNADTDFFSFLSPRKGSVNVEFRNRSNSLVPVLAVYNKDRRNIGFAQDAVKPGSNLRHTIDANKDEMFYLQISSQSGTAGPYVLRVD
jgi:hypothetical protein